MIDWQRKVIGPSVRVFGQPAVYRMFSDQYITEIPIFGIYDEAYVSVDVVNDMQVTSTSPCFGINLSDLPSMPQQKDLILIKAALGSPAKDTEYQVKLVRPDGRGGCRLLLNLAAMPRDYTSKKGTQDQ